MTAPWKVVEVKADDDSAWVTSKIEVYKQPDLDGAVSLRP